MVEWFGWVLAFVFASTTGILLAKSKDDYEMLGRALKALEKCSDNMKEVMVTQHTLHIITDQSLSLSTEEQKNTKH